jgi:hypothetical protein
LVAETCPADTAALTLLDSRHAGYSTPGSDVVEGASWSRNSIEASAQRVRVLAENADPFTRRRLLDLAKRYDAKGCASRSGAVERPLPAPRTTPPTSNFSGPGEV